MLHRKEEVRASSLTCPQRLAAILAGDESDPFSYLGIHRVEENGALVVVSFTLGRLP